MLGRDLEIAATERLLSGTPKPLRKKAFLGARPARRRGAHYQLAVYPLQRKAQLRKTSPAARSNTWDRQERRKRQGAQRSQRAAAAGLQRHQRPRKGRLPASSPTSAHELVAEVTDKAAGELQGRASRLAVGAAKNAKGSSPASTTSSSASRTPSEQLGP